MISIRVCHQQNNEANELVDDDNNKQVESNQQQPIAKPRNNRPIASIKTTTLTSNVEVQYLTAKEYLNLLDTPPQTPTYEKFFTKVPSTTNIATAPTTKMDSNNNTKNNEIVQQNNNKQAQQQKNKLHSRSISLIINPEFIDSDSDNIELNSLRRRKSLPRRTRLRLVTDQKLTTTTTSTSQMNEDQMNDNDDHKSANYFEFNCKNADDENNNNNSSLTELNQNISIATNSSPDILEQFRQTGVILRQISDEFEK